MIHMKWAALALASLTLACGPAMAQSGGSMAKDSMAKDSMAKDAMGKDSMGKDSMAIDSMKMSKADTRAVKTCNALSHDAAMKSAKCQSLAKAHPGAITSIANADSMMVKH